jgi:thioredoxin 1
LGAPLVAQDVPVLVDFYAAWCGPCKLVAPLMEWAASEYSGRLKVVKIDTEIHGRFVNRYGIHGLPTFAVFRNGEAFGVQEGALGKKGLQEYILTHVPELK